MLDNIQDLQGSEVENFIKNNDGILIFHKTLCPMCKVMGKVLLKAKESNPALELASVDTEKEVEILEKYKVERVPTMLFIKSGEIKLTKSGTLKPVELLDAYSQA